MNGLLVAFASFERRRFTCSPVWSHASKTRAYILFKNSFRFSGKKYWNLAKANLWIIESRSRAALQGNKVCFKHFSSKHQCQYFTCLLISSAVYWKHVIIKVFTAGFTFQRSAGGSDLWEKKNHHRVRVKLWICSLCALFHNLRI